MLVFKGALPENYLRSELNLIVFNSPRFAVYFKGTVPVVENVSLVNVNFKVSPLWYDNVPIGFFRTGTSFLTVNKNEISL